LFVAASTIKVIDVTRKVRVLRPKYTMKETKKWEVLGLPGLANNVGNGGLGWNKPDCRRI